MSSSAGFSTAAVDAAFGSLRAAFGDPLEPFLGMVEDDDELDAMSWTDGLNLLPDGPHLPTPPALPAGGVPAPTVKRQTLLWAIRLLDVVYADALCSFGLSRSRGEVKHTNLTGGEDAYGGGELVHLGGGVLLLNGDSGRYRLRSEAELRAVFLAFVQSGYGVWGLGWDHEGNRPIPSGAGGMPTWVV